MSRAWAKLFCVLPMSCLSACGGATTSTESPANVTCPAGQTFDGSFCQVDQNVATKESLVVSDPKLGEGENPERDPATEQTRSQETVTEGGETQPAVPGSTREDGVAVTEPVEPPATDQDDPVEAAPIPPAHATPVDITMAAQAAPIVQYLASSHLPSGSRPFGAPFAAQFAEGQVFEQKVQLAAGKCYTVVAVAMHPVKELNVFLYEEGNEQPVASDDTQGHQAVLGSRSGCFRPSQSASMKLVLQVERGQGVAAAQIFQK